MCKAPFRHTRTTRWTLGLMVSLVSIWVLRGVGRGTPSPGQASTPNIVFILTDDLDARSIGFMPKLKSLVADRGTTFANFFVTNSLCCPSRASFLTGKYVHNHGVFTNSFPPGGFQKFHDTGGESSTVATWLKTKGYRTMLAGKYLNGYRDGKAMAVPPGWDEWYATLQDEETYSYYFFSINENGRRVQYQNRPEDYLTDVVARKATDFIERAAADTRPFFLYLAPYAPHLPATPAPRHQNEFHDITAPHSPSFNEEDVTDKPQWVRRAERLTPAEILEIDEVYRRRLQSLLAVDDMIEEIIRSLGARDRMTNTFIFFSSDNGFHMGEHRLPSGKGTAYEEDIRVPLIVRGPGVPARSTVDHFALNIDLAPTFAQLAGAKTPDAVDGLSLVPLLGNSLPSVDAWRKDFLIEHWADRGDRVRPYSALRTRDYLYVDYATGERELYNLRTDPNELTSIHSSASHALMKELGKRLNALERCKGATCQR